MGIRIPPYAAGLDLPRGDPRFRRHAEKRATGDQRQFSIRVYASGRDRSDSRNTADRARVRAGAPSDAARASRGPRRFRVALRGMRIRPLGLAYDLVPDDAMLPEVR